MIVTCPWLDRKLAPNGRIGWGERTRRSGAYKRACWAATREAGAASVHLDAEGDIPVHLTFCHPTKRRWDDDNLEAAFKAGRDGIALALGCDDARFVVTRSIGEPVKGGCVIVQIGGAE